MSLPSHLSWGNFRASILVPGQQRVHRVSNHPRIELFGNGDTNQIGMWLPGDDADPRVLPADVTRLSFITIRTVDRDRSRLLEIATTRTPVHRQFYHFALAVADRVATEESTAIDAICLELKCFSDLLEEKALLAAERQIGLIGELLFLDHLVDRIGTRGFDSWIGPWGEPHDFRVDKTEFEVKTTVSPQRVHTINGLDQLVPSKDCVLNLISIVLGPPGASASLSLPEVVDRVMTRCAPARRARFANALIESGYQTDDASHYERRYAMRRPIAVIQIDESFPAITRPAIHTSLGPNAARIEAVSYDVDVEGLERELGSPGYESAVPHNSVSESPP